MTYLPKFSIVIPNLNGGNFLEEAILSVLHQNYPNIELIIIDGGSKDNSVEIIKKYAAHLAYWESKPDRGQAHAINKGLEKATGDLFDWLNSDDRIAPGTFRRVVQAFEEQPYAFVVCGKMTHFGGDLYQTPVRMRVFPQMEKSILFGSLSGPSMYFKLDKFRVVGQLDERLHFCFDLEFWCRFLEKFGQERTLFIDDNLSYFRLHPGSKSVNFLDSFSEDQYLIFRSILNALGKKEPSELSPDRIGIHKNYERKWSFPKLNTQLFYALFLHKMIEKFHHRITFPQIFAQYTISFILAPFRRSWSFYLLPIRAVRWKVLGKLGIYKTWVSDYKSLTKN